MDYFPPQPNLLLRASHGRFLILPWGLQAPGLQRFAVFSDGYGFNSGALHFDEALRAAGRDGGMLAIRGFYNQWRFGDAASFNDQTLLSLLARDVRAGSLVAFYLPDEAYVTVTLASADAAQAAPSPGGPVSGWSVKQKLVAMFEAVPDFLTGAAKAEFLAFLSPANFAVMAGILVAIAGVQAIPGADAVVDGLIIALAWLQFGWAGLLAARDFVQAVAQAGQAKSDDEIKLAAKLAAAALVSLGLVVFLKKLTGKVNPGRTQERPPAQPPPEPTPNVRPMSNEQLPNFAQNDRNKIILSGHGGAGQNVLRVPKDTSVTTYAPYGASISDPLGNVIETGGDTSNVYSEKYGPGDEMPDYILYPPDDGLKIMGSPVTVSQPTPLSALIKPGGDYHFAACTYDANSPNANLVYDVPGVFNTTTNSYETLYPAAEPVEPPGEQTDDP